MTSRLALPRPVHWWETASLWTARAQIGTGPTSGTTRTGPGDQSQPRGSELAAGHHHRTTARYQDHGKRANIEQTSARAQ